MNKNVSRQLMEDVHLGRYV